MLEKKQQCDKDKKNIESASYSCTKVGMRKVDDFWTTMMFKRQFPRGKAVLCYVTRPFTPMCEKA